MAEKEWKDQARKEFDDWADEYDDSVLQKYLFEPAHNELIRVIPQLGSRRVLDIGCGTGVLAMNLAATGDDMHIEGLDLSESMIRVAREKATHPERMNFSVGDSEELPFDDASFDCITCSNSFHHYPRPEKVLAGFRRVLAPGGSVLVVDGDRDQVWGFFIFEVVVRIYEGMKVHHHKRSEFTPLLTDAGFGEISFTKIPVRWPLPMPLMLVRGQVAK